MGCQTSKSEVSEEEREKRRLSMRHLCDVQIDFDPVDVPPIVSKEAGKVNVINDSDAEIHAIESAWNDIVREMESGRIAKSEIACEYKSTSSGSTSAPSRPQSGQFYFDEDEKILKTCHCEEAVVQNDEPGNDEISPPPATPTEIETTQLEN
jgi:hypothetical protein